MSNHVLLVLHVYSFTTSMRAVIYCIKETKLNPNDKENVKTTSLLRSPVVNSHLHEHQRPQKSHLSVSAATYLTPFSTYGRIISVLSMAAGIFAWHPLFYVHSLTEMMRGTERRLIWSDVPDHPPPPSQGPTPRRPGLASLALGCFCSRTGLFLFAGTHANNLLGWSGGLSEGVGSRGVGKNSSGIFLCSNAAPDDEH